MYCISCAGNWDLDAPPLVEWGKIVASMMDVGFQESGNPYLYQWDFPKAPEEYMSINKGGEYWSLATKAAWRMWGNAPESKTTW
jgi:hypothetical protein